MNRIAWLFAFALAACVDSGCPKGSEEVGGTCMSVSSVSQEDGGGLGDGAVMGLPDADAGGDAGAGRDSGADAGRALGCEDLACDEHASCDDDDDDGAEAASCVCEPGFEGDGMTCTDIDECADGSAACSEDAACQNEPGGFTCTCNPGFEGDGTTCDANPCEPRADPCDAATSTCRVDGDAAVCECLEGLGRCDGDPHACNTDLQADAAHCGACGAACAGDLACEEGACDQAVTQLVLGLRHSCAVEADGDVLCWGANDYGQLGREGAFVQQHEPTPTRFGKADLLAAGPEASCAILQDDDLVCWGLNDFQWIAPGDEQGAFTVASGITDIDQLSIGIMTACVIAAGGVSCWGLNLGYSHGHADSRQRTFSERVTVPIPDAVQVSSGATSCAVTTDATVFCWGDQVAPPRAIVDATDTPLSEVRNVDTSDIEATACAAMADGRAMCWGDNGSGQIGNPAAPTAGTSAAVPVADERGTSLTDVEQVAVGVSYACARKGDGSVWCWGRRDRLGNGGSGSASQPFATRVRGVEDAIDLAAGGYHACVRLRSGQVQCWGDNTDGQLGVNRSPSTGGVTFSGAPVNVLGLP